MASSRVPTRVSHRRARCPLRCADRSSLRSYRSAPTSAVTSASISPCTKCRTASRRKSPSGNSSLRRTSNKLMLSSATASLLSKLCLTALGMHAVAAFVKPGCPPDLHHVLGHYLRYLVGIRARRRVIELDRTTTKRTGEDLRPDRVVDAHPSPVSM